MHRSCPLVLALLVAAPATAQSEVDLYFVPGGCVDVGEVVRVDLFAASADPNTLAISGLDVIVEWDPAEVTLVDTDNSAAGYPWLITGFLPDPGGINASTVDGQALFTALASPSVPAAVPPSPGIVVTTFLFRPLTNLPTGSSIRMGAQAGAFAETAVYSFQSPGLALTGDISDVATIFTCPFGARFCGAAVPNSTGQTGRIEALGSPVIATNDLQLAVSRLPLQSFGFVVCSRDQDFRPFPGGSQGILCLADPIGRGVGDVIYNTGTTGTALIDADLLALPQPMGPEPAVVGETWNFQGWHRDVNPVQTSNFTDAIEITFQ